MGADYLGAMCPMEISKDEAKARLRRYKEEWLLSHLDDYFCQQYDETDDKTEYQQAIEWVDECIEATYGYYEHGSRETAVYRYRDIDFLVTGGLSWGDDPTDAFQPIGVVQSLELTVAFPELARSLEPWKEQQ